MSEKVANGDVLADDADAAVEMQNRTVIRMYQIKILMIPDRTIQM